MAYTFISYSRKQLYFAEAIALHLQKEGVEIWFDLQQLRAGADWASALKDGYENCQQLILVVSRAALASEYVEAEWDTALQHGREVILAVVEDVEVPEKLRDCAMIDFRTDFNAAMKRLVFYLTGDGPAPKDRIPAPGKFPYPFHMPFPIWFTIISVMWPYAWALMLPLSALGLAPIVMGILVFIAGVHRFWKHNLHYQGVRYLGWLALSTQLIVTVGALVSLTNFPVAYRGPFIVFVILPVIICLILNVYFSFWFVNRSAPLLRWFAGGQASQKLRRQCHARLLSGNAQLGKETFESEPVDLFLHNDPADRPMARRIAKILSKAGHREVDDVNKAQKHLYLITNRTSRKMVEGASKTGEDTSIFLLGSSINWSESLENAGKTQFVDLRELDVNDMEVFAGSLSNMDMWRREYALESTPTKFESPVVPTSVKAYRFLAFLHVAVFLGNGLYRLTEQQFGAGLQVLSGIGLFFLVEYALQRRVPLLIALGVDAGISLFSGYSWLFMVVILYIARPWFPSFASHAKDALGMGKVGKNKTWDRIFVAVVTLVYLAASVSGAAG